MAVAPALDELLQGRDGFRGRLAVQVEHAARRVVSAFNLSELASVDARRDISIVVVCRIVTTCRRDTWTGRSGGLGYRRYRGLKSSGRRPCSANAPADVRCERDDIRHRLGEMTSVSVGSDRGSAFRRTTHCSETRQMIARSRMTADAMRAARRNAPFARLARYSFAVVTEGLPLYLDFLDLPWLSRLRETL
jgi:hypothetical protein